MATEVESLNAHDAGVFLFDHGFGDAEESYGVDGDALIEAEAAAEAEANGNWTPQEKALHEARLKAKAKRRLRRTSSRDSARESLSDANGDTGSDPHSPKGKINGNDRKSRMGKGRGLPKKGGAGGKGVWGAAGMVYEMDEPDVKDPNYDEFAHVSMRPGAGQGGGGMLALWAGEDITHINRDLGDTVFATVVPELDERELEKTVNPIVQEYFEHGDTKEVQMLLKELNLGHNKFEVSSLAVSLSLEGKASHRELTSRLLSDLAGKVLTENEMARAFDKMLQDLPDLILDTPDAPQLCWRTVEYGKLLLDIVLFGGDPMLVCTITDRQKRVWGSCAPFQESDFVACSFQLNAPVLPPFCRSGNSALVDAVVVITPQSSCSDTAVSHSVLESTLSLLSMLGQFIARAVADHALPMEFLSRYKGRVDCDHARAALDRAAVLLSMKREIVRLDNVWGVGGGQRPVKHLIKEMNLLLKEYLVSGEVSEAEHCLKDLEVPHFHHELVYEAVVMVLESKGETAIKIMVKLLKAFWKTGLITLDQMNRGFQRVYVELPEITLDVPHAHTILETFVDLCYQEAVITKQLRDACPSRSVPLLWKPLRACI
ncbi:hypothetical protein JZ751_012631 [Albula glossodonta]|uniref:Programmed cell death protein 4 n=1 Tax=Albula glossodonta TaxID=121402 RepID=A0A8T2NVF1_9TELE|nr:hypothetical protein JZ751_012631 [Albula glossodonta]